MTARSLTFTAAAIIAVLGIVWGVAILFGQKANDGLAIDNCLDGGGCWDERDQVCRKTESNAQALCDRSSEREL